jgi:hypothetical protein
MLVDQDDDRTSRQTSQTREDASAVAVTAAGGRFAASVRAFAPTDSPPGCFLHPTDS